MPIGKIPMFGEYSGKYGIYFDQNSSKEVLNMLFQNTDQGDYAELVTRPSFEYRQPIEQDWVNAPRVAKWMIFYPSLGRMLCSMFYPNTSTEEYADIDNGQTIRIIGSVNNACQLNGSPILVYSSGVQYALFANQNQQLTYIDSSRVVNTLPTGVGGNDAQKCVYLDGYVIKFSNGDTKFYFSSAGDFTTWSALDFVDVGDIIRSIHVFNDYIYIFTTSKTLRYYNDGSTPFAKAQGQDINKGSVGIASVVDDGNHIYYLTFDNSFGRINGSQFEELGRDMYNSIKDMVKFSPESTNLFHFYYNGRNYISIYNESMLSNRYQLVYEVESEKWHKWTLDDNSGNRIPAVSDIKQHLRNNNSFPANYFASRGYDSSVSNRSDICQLGFRGYDLTRQSNNLPSDRSKIDQELITGLIDHGTHLKKRSKVIRIKARKPSVLFPSDNIMRLSYRDNITDSFTTLQDFSLNSSDDDIITLEKWSNGVYRQRQYKIDSSAVSEYRNAVFDITDFEEEYEILGS